MGSVHFYRHCCGLESQTCLNHNCSSHLPFGRFLQKQSTGRTSSAPVRSQLGAREKKPEGTIRFASNAHAARFARPRGWAIRPALELNVSKHPAGFSSAPVWFPIKQAQLVSWWCFFEGTFFCPWFPLSNPKNEYRAHLWVPHRCCHVISGD